jgi:hypothetical protein
LITRVEKPKGATTMNAQPPPLLAVGMALPEPPGLVVKPLCEGILAGDPPVPVLKPGTALAEKPGFGGVVTGAGGGADEAGGAGTLIDEMCEEWETCETCPPEPDT